MGMERLIGLNSDEREQALKFLDSKRSQIEKSFETFYDKLDKGLTSFEKKDENYHITRYFDDKKDFKDEVSERLDKLYAGLRNKKKLFGNSVNKMRFKLCSVRGMNNIKYITTFILSCIPYVGGLISCALILTDEDERKAQKVVKTVGDAASSVFETKIYIKTGINDGENITYDLFFYLKINLKKFWQQGGLEDFDAEVATIEENLDSSLISDIENGKITIGVPDTTHTEDTDGSTNVDITDVSEHTDDGATGNENPDQVPTELTVSTPNEGEEPETNDTVSVEGYGTKEYLDHKYGNENLGKVIVPLSPTKLDMIDIPKTNALACVYAKGSEGIDSLRSVVTARFDILEDIVNREHDEELTKKFDEYKKFAIESFDGAVDIQNSMAAIGITPYGLIDKEDPVSLYIGSKAHRYLSHDLSIKNKYPKKSFESLNDAIDAAFDIAILKDAARNSKSKDDLIVLNKERASREDLFWNNIVGLDGDEEKKDQIKNILQFADLDIDTRALVDTEYLNSINIALDTQKIPVPGKCENEIHEELFNSAKERIESFLGKDIDGSQIDIIRAMIEGRDTSDYAPTTFEKFIIKLGTDEALEKNGGKDFEVGQESAELIKNKAIILTALNAFVDKVNPMNEHDTKEFKEYIGL